MKPSDGFDRTLLRYENDCFLSLTALPRAGEKVFIMSVITIVYRGDQEDHATSALARTLPSSQILRTTFSIAAITASAARSFRYMKESAVVGRALRHTHTSPALCAANATSSRM